MKLSFFQLQTALHKTTETADLVTFTEEILKGKLHILCSAISKLIVRKDKINRNTENWVPVSL